LNKCRVELIRHCTETAQEQVHRGPPFPPDNSHILCSGTTLTVVHEDISYPSSIRSPVFSENTNILIKLIIERRKKENIYRKKKEKINNKIK